MNQHLVKTIKQLNPNTISAERISALNHFASSLSNALTRKDPVRLNFICTHNSRRSHFAQLWAQALGRHFDLPLQCYSGGTEATAVYQTVIETLSKQGFVVEQLSEGKNPIYQIKMDENGLPVLAFSKKYDHSYNPKSKFTAVMTCSHADENCPVVFGAEHRVSLPYNDPKQFDGTQQEAEQYEKTSIQIATELYYAFSNCQPA